MSPVFVTTVVLIHLQLTAFSFKDFIYSFMRETQAEGEAGSLGADVGLDPGSPGSDPGRKAGD